MDLTEALLGALAAEFPRSLTAPRPEDADTIVRRFFGGNNAAAAREIEISEGLSHESAMRYVQRARAYGRGDRGRQARRPTRTVDRLARIARAGIAAKYRGGARVTITGHIRVSQKVRYRTVVVVIPRGDVDAFLDPFVEGDWAGTVAGFMDAFAEHYLPDMEFEEIDGLTLEPSGS